MAIIRTIVAGIFKVLALPFFVVMVVSWFVMVISVPAVVVFGLWDLLAWATNAGWKTSDFMISIASAIVFVASWMCMHVSLIIGSVVWGISEKIEPN